MKNLDWQGILALTLFAVGTACLPFVVLAAWTRDYEEYPQCPPPCPCPCPCHESGPSSPESGLHPLEPGVIENVSQV